MFSRFFFLRVFAFSLCLGLSSCNSDSTVKEVSEELRLNLGCIPCSMDPAYPIDVPTHQVLEQLFDPLVRRGNGDELIPAAAESWDWDEDGLGITFHLKEAKWSDGKEVSADDFVYAWKRAAAPGFPSAACDFLFFLENGEEVKLGKKDMKELGVWAEDSRTLRVRLSSQAPFFPALASRAPFYPIPAHIDRENPNWWTKTESYVSNGPYRLVKVIHNDSITVEKNPHFNDEGLWKIPRVVFMVVLDANTQLRLFEKGELDFIGRPFQSLPMNAESQLRREGKLDSLPFEGTYWYTFNTEIFPLQSKKIRKALCKAIDRERITSDVITQLTTPARGIVPPIYSKAQKFNPQDETSPKELLEEGLSELGISLKDLPVFKIAYNDTEENMLVAQEVQQEWTKELGIRVELEKKDWAIHLADLQEGNYMIGRFGWIDFYPDPTAFLNCFGQSPECSTNHSKWRNGAYKLALEMAEKEGDLDKRLQLLNEAEQLIVEEMPIAPIFHYQKMFYHKTSSLQGFELYPLGSFDLRNANKTLS